MDVFFHSTDCRIRKSCKIVTSRLQMLRMPCSGVIEVLFSSAFPRYYHKHYRHCLYLNHEDHLLDLQRLYKKS